MCLISILMMIMFCHLAGFSYVYLVRDRNGRQLALVSVCSPDTVTNLSLCRNSC